MLQDNLREDGKTDVSIIKSKNGVLEFYKENDGKIWMVTSEGVILDKTKQKTR